MKNTNLVLTASSPNTWKLEGELTMMSLSSVWRLLDNSRPVKSGWQIDFSKVNQMDSGGVAYLLDCIRYAESLKLELGFLSLSNEVFELIEAQGVMSLIEPYLKKKNEPERN